MTVQTVQFSVDHPIVLQKNMSKSDLIQIMKQRAETVQAIVSKITDMEEAVRYTVDLTQKQGGRTVAAA